MEEYIAPNRKRIPYGMMNYAVIRRDDCYYVDKTRFIPMIEEADKFFFFIRPHRFGKSLTVSMLQHYYDIRAKDKFDALFGDLYIGKYPTRDRNSYLVLYLNFSGIVGELHNYRKGLDAHCQTTFETFAKYMPTVCHRIHWVNCVLKMERWNNWSFFIRHVLVSISASISSLMNTTTLLMLSSRMLRE